MKVEVKTKQGNLKGFLAKLERKIGRQPVMRMGFLDGATYANGTKVAMIAAIQEFGAPNARFPIPPRPFFRPVVKRGETKWPKDLVKALKATDNDAIAALTIVGDVAAGELRQSINNLKSPPLSAVTVMLRSMRRQNPSMKVGLSTVFEAIGRVKAGQRPVGGTSAKPLIDSGTLVKHISSEVTRSWR